MEVQTVVRAHYAGQYLRGGTMLMCFLPPFSFFFSSSFFFPAFHFQNGSGRAREMIEINKYKRKRGKQQVGIDGQVANRQSHPGFLCLLQGPDVQGCHDRAYPHVPRPSAPRTLVLRMVLSLCASKGTRRASSFVGAENTSEEMGTAALARTITSGQHETF